MNTAAIGTYTDLSEASYHAIDLCSNSRLTTIHERSPAHMRYEADHPSEPTPALVTGTALHCLVLMGDECFGSRYVVAPKCSAATKDGKPCSNPAKGRTSDGWVCGVHGKGREFLSDPRILLSSEQWEQCQGMRDSITAHADAMNVLKCAGHREYSVIFSEPTTSLLCKMRADIVVPSVALIADIKTTESASREDFERSIFNFGYHRQAAFYITGLMKAGIECKEFAFIAVEKEPPYAVAVHQLKQDAIERGWAELEPLIATYAECEHYGTWPAYPGINFIGLPSWAYRRDVAA